MKKILGYIFVMILTVCIGCNDDNDDNNRLPEIKPEARGTVKDNDGNEYGWVRYAGLDWMTCNFKGGTTPYYELQYTDEWDDLYYLIDTDREQAAADWENYGNMYTYEEALNNEKLLPEGWRLPTDEDWKRLEQAMGMSESEANATGLRGSVEGALLQQDATGTDMLLRLGGYVLVYGRPAVLRHRHLREYGYFWTATKVESENDKTLAPTVYYRKISCVTSQIERNATKSYDTNYEGNFSKYMSVRYVRDAQD